MALENVEEFFAEAVNAVGETANAVVVVVVGGDCRNGGKEADGSGYQRLGNARRNNGETCVFKARERVSPVRRMSLWKTYPTGT